MSELSSHSTWRVSEERHFGTVTVRLEILNEPTSSAVWRSLGRELLQFALDPLGDVAKPSYSRSRVVRVWAERPQEPEISDYGHNYESAQWAFARWVAEAEDQM